MRFRIFGIEQGSLLVGLDCPVRIAGFEHVSQRQPGAGLALGNVRSGFQFGGGAQKLFGVGLARFHQHQAEIQIGFEYPGLGRDGLAVRGNRVVGLAQRVVEKSQVKPGGKVVGILRHHFFQQRLGGGVILLLDRALGLDEFRGEEGSSTATL